MGEDTEYDIGETEACFNRSLCSSNPGEALTETYGRDLQFFIYSFFLLFLLPQTNRVRSKMVTTTDD